MTAPNLSFIRPQVNPADDDGLDDVRETLHEIEKLLQLAAGELDSTRYSIWDLQNATREVRRRLG